jgi:RNA polymerase sigma-70 factor (ECF subfamily)
VHQDEAVLKVDPLRNPEPLIRRVYAYVAYRLGDGPDAEDVTSETFERALRYRSSFDASKGPPVAWLIGIARRCVDDALSGRAQAGAEPQDVAAPSDLELETVRRIDLRKAMAALDERDRELLALRYGADLKARQIAELLDLKTNAVEVALHRALKRLRERLGADDPGNPGEPVLGAVRI